MPIGRWLGNAGRWLLRWVKPLGKAAMVAIVQREGDTLQVRLKTAIALRGAEAIDKMIDEWQARLVSGINAIRLLPASIKGEAARVIQTHGDWLQDSLHKAVADGGPVAIDKTFDISQDVLIQRIQAL